MANAPGAGWSAIGAALTNGMGAFRDQAQATLQQKRENLTNALLQDQLNELPKKHAEDDLTRLLAVQGDAAYDNPQLQQFAKAAGVPFQTASPEKPPTAPGSGGMLADQWDPVPGVAPHSGIVLPPDVAMRASDRQRKQVTDDLATKALTAAYGEVTPGQGPTGFDRDANGVPADTPHNRQLGGMLGANDPIVKIHGPAGNSPDNAAARVTAEQNAKAVIPPANALKVLGAMKNSASQLDQANAELAKNYQGIEKGIDANGNLTQDAPYNGYTDSAMAKMHRMDYGFRETPYSKGIQLGSLGNVEEWPALVPGRINPQIIDAIKTHQGEYGEGQSPMATYARNFNLAKLMRANADNLLPFVTPQKPGALAEDVTQSGPASTQSGSPAPAAPSGQRVVPWSRVVAAAASQPPTSPLHDPKNFAAKLKAEGAMVVQ